MNIDRRTNSYIDGDGFRRIVQLSNENGTVNERLQSFDFSATDIYEEERAASNLFRFNGTINFLSLICGCRTDLTRLDEIFYRGNVKRDTQKTFANMFVIYICTYLDSVSIGNGQRQKRYTIISKKSDFKIYDMMYARNIYGKQIENFQHDAIYDIDADFVYLFIAPFDSNSYTVNTIILGDVISADDTIVPMKKYVQYDLLDKDDNTVSYYFWYSPFIEIGLYETDGTKKQNFLFTNNVHYIYQNIVFTLLPDMDDVNTKNAFSDFELMYDEIILKDAKTTIDENRCDDDGL